MNDQSIEDNTPNPLAYERQHQRARLRQQMLAARLSLSYEQWQASSLALAEHVANDLSKIGLPKPGQVVAFCWPIQNEPDLRALMAKWLAELGIVPALPVVVSPQQALKFRAWRPGEKLANDRYGIPTPVVGDWVVPELLLLPGNAFDESGYRLGYGGGFFDRTLAAMYPRPFIVGVCFESARVADLYPQAHDQPVDVIVTERGLQVCRSIGN